MPSKVIQQIVQREIGGYTGVINEVPIQLRKARTRAVRSPVGQVGVVASRALPASHGPRRRDPNPLLIRHGRESPVRRLMGFERERDLESRGLGVQPTDKTAAEGKPIPPHRSRSPMLSKRSSRFFSQCCKPGPRSRPAVSTVHRVVRNSSRARSLSIG